MAGFDIGSLLNGLLGNKQQAAAPQDGSQQGQPGQPQQPGSGAAGGLGGLLNSDMLAKLGPMLSGLLAGGGMAKLLGQLKGGGLGDQAKSWVATDQANKPVSGEQLTQALGPDTISQYANKLGVSDEQAAATMAQTLPTVVDAMTPEGQVPQGAGSASGGGAGTGPASAGGGAGTAGGGPGTR